MVNTFVWTFVAQPDEGRSVSLRTAAASLVATGWCGALPKASRVSLLAPKMACLWWVNGCSTSEQWKVLRFGGEMWSI